MDASGDEERLEVRDGWAKEIKSCLGGGGPIRHVHVDQTHVARGDGHANILARTRDSTVAVAGTCVLAHAKDVHVRTLST